MLPPGIRYFYPMGTLRIACFGFTRELVGARTVDLEWSAAPVAELRATLRERYRGLAQVPRLAIAVNLNYATDDLLVHPGDEVALIPPVSGG